VFDVLLSFWEVPSAVVSCGLDPEVADDLVGVLPNKGFTGNPPIGVDGFELLENVLNGLWLEPKIEPLPEVPVLFVDPKPPLPKAEFLEDAESAAKPPGDDEVLDPNVGDENPNLVAGFVAVDVLPLSDEVVPKADFVVAPKNEVAPKTADVAVPSSFMPNALNGEVPVDGLPNVRPLDVPDPKAEAEVLALEEPNVVGPEAPKEKVGAAVLVVS